MDKTTSHNRRYKPYPSKRQVEQDACPRKQQNIKDLTKQLLTTLTHPKNPLSHSNIEERSDYVSSTTSGHQRAETANPRQYSKFRNQKLLEQQSEAMAGILKHVTVYINGFLSGTTDIEMKRTVTKAGGKISNTPSGATHIVTSSGLSASKAQVHFLRGKAHVVQ